MNPKYLKDTRDKARQIADLSHTGMEARDIIKELINITEQVEGAIGAQMSDNIDQRMLQKRYEALKVEHRDVHKKLDSIRDVTGKMAGVIKALSSEVGHISDTECAGRVKSSIKQLVEILTKI